MARFLASHVATSPALSVSIEKDNLYRHRHRWADLGRHRTFFDCHSPTSDVASLTLPRSPQSRSPAIAICGRCNVGPNHGHLAESSHERKRHHRTRPAPAGFVGLRVRMADVWRRCSQRRWAQDAERVVSRGESAAVPPLRPEVYEAIQAWKPHTDTDNPQVMAVVAPAVRAVVAASAPETPELARRWLPLRPSDAGLDRQDRRVAGPRCHKSPQRRQVRWASQPGRGPVAGLEERSEECSDSNRPSCQPARVGATRRP